jgi:hypothetical protein
VRAILIDPRLRRIIDVELGEENELAEMRRLIGAETLDHQRISDMRDYIWVDGAGLLRGACWAFKLRSMGPFAGTAIIIGSDPAGETREPFVKLVMIQNDIDWLDEIEPEIHYMTERTKFAGKPFVRQTSIVTYSRPKRP